MRRLTIILAIIGMLTGCSATKDWKNEQKIQAHRRWAGAQAQVVCSVGNEYLKTGELDKAAGKAAEALALDEDFLPARVLMGKILLAQGRYIEAAKEFTLVGERTPDNPEIAFLKGVALEKRGEHAEALQCYQRARALDPANDAYVTASAEVLTAWDKPQLAMELLETRIERSDVDATVLALAGEIAMLLDQPARAVTFYRRAADLQPKSLALQEALAKAHFFSGQYAEALRVLRGLSERAEYRDKSAWVYLMMGDAALATNLPTEARRCYETATVIEPDDGPAWACLAKAALWAGDAGEAIIAARRALTLMDNALEATIVLGYALMTEGKMSEAVEVLAPAAAGHPRQAVLQCALGRCYEALGRTDRAVACYAQALRAEPNHPLAKSLMASAGLTAGEIR